jgi:type IV pilus assembly protein PilB
LTLRLLQKSAVRLHFRELGFFEEQESGIEQWLAESSGMFLVAGPVGCGKTTTLYALLNEMRLMRKSIITI